MEKWIWENSGMSKNIAFHHSTITKIIDLVERRRVYFYIYHGVDMSEWNEIALYCFWINKLKPFYAIAGSNGKVDNPLWTSDYLNATIAVRLLRNTVKRMSGKLYMNIGNLHHSFRYRDLSKECIMSVIESFL